MELGAVEQFPEDQRDLRLHDARPVILHGHAKTIRLRLLHVHPDLRHDPRLFACVERIVDGFLDSGQQCFARIVETQQVAVLGEELADRDIPLLGRHRFGRRPPPRVAVVRRGVRGSSVRLAVARTGRLAAGCSWDEWSFVCVSPWPTLTTP